MRFALLLAALLVAPAALAAPPPPDLTARLQSVLTGNESARAHASGQALAVIGPKARWMFEGAEGAASFGGEAMTPAHAFRIASVTKPYTAAAILKLAEQGRLDIDDPIERYVSAQTAKTLRDGGYSPGEITVRQLLAHTSGLWDHAEDEAYVTDVVANLKRRWTRAEQIRIAAKLTPPKGKPGERFSYSDTGYVILGEIIERLTGKSVGAATRDLLNFDKIGLKATWWEDLEPAPAKTPPLAHIYFAKTDMTGADASFDLYGGGGVVATVGDLARFYRALVRGEVFDDPRTLATMMSVSPAERPLQRLDTNAVHLIPLGRHQCWGHTGFWGAIAAYCPSTDIAFAWTQNQNDGLGDSYRVMRDRLAEALEPAAPK